jgi:hypothetical protein
MVQAAKIMPRFELQEAVVRGHKTGILPFTPGEDRPAVRIGRIKPGYKCAGVQVECHRRKRERSSSIRFLPRRVFRAALRTGARIWSKVSFSLGGRGTISAINLSPIRNVKVSPARIRLVVAPERSSRIVTVSHLSFIGLM